MKNYAYVVGVSTLFVSAATCSAEEPQDEQSDE